jgi:hypothetical protein
MYAPSPWTRIRMHCSLPFIFLRIFIICYRKWLAVVHQYSALASRLPHIFRRRTASTYAQRTCVQQVGVFAHPLNQRRNMPPIFKKSGRSIFKKFRQSVSRKSGCKSIPASSTVHFLSSINQSVGVHVPSIRALSVCPLYWSYLAT